MKHIKLFENFDKVNEKLRNPFKRKLTKISFPNKINGRKHYDIVDITDNSVKLADGDDTLTISKDGKISDHYNGKTKMIMTWNADDVTMDELDSIFKV